VDGPGGMLERVADCTCNRSSRGVSEDSAHVEANDSNVCRVLKSNTKDVGEEEPSARMSIQWDVDHVHLHSIRSVECGVWSVECGVWSVEWSLRIEWRGMLVWVTSPIARAIRWRGGGNEDLSIPGNPRIQGYLAHKKTPSRRTLQ